MKRPIFETKEGLEEYQNSKNLNTFLAHFRKLGENFNSQNYKKQVSKLMNDLNLRIEIYKRAMPVLQTCEDEIKKFIEKTEILSPEESLQMGARICCLENLLCGLKDLTSGLGAVAIGRALYLQPENNSIYAELAVLAETSKNHLLSPEEIRHLHQKSATSTRNQICY